VKRRTLVLLGLAVFVASAAFLAPANVLHGWLATRLAANGVQLSGVDGSVSRGRVAQVGLNGNLLVRDLDWTMRRWHLLLGRASFALAGGRDGTLVDGTASVLLSGALDLTDFRLALPVQQGFAAAGYPFVPVQGQLGLDLEHLKLREGWPDKGKGTLAVRGLAWKLGREPVPLGDYEAVLDEELGGVKADVRTLGGTLEVTGKGHLGADRRYELHLQMRPKPNAPPMVQNLVRNLGQPDAQGWYHLRRNGVAQPAAGTGPLP